MNAKNQGKIAQDKDNEFVQECKVTVTEKGYEIHGRFHCVIPRDVNDEPGTPINELDHIEQHIEQLGQQFKRIVCRETLEAADENIARVFKLAQGQLRKNGKRTYEGLSAIGLTKDKRKALEREILGHLWHGETAQAVWILWGLRSSARIPQRIDDLIGYLLRKKHVIVNYAQRREQGFWLASTWVEKWNDVAVSEWCKHRGMSWTSQGVLAIALYAAEQKRKVKQTTTQIPNFNSTRHTTP
jgi:hypothetical protein